MPRAKFGLTQLAFGAVILVQLFFLVNGAALFPSYWTSQNWATWLPIYLFLSFGGLALSVFTSGSTPFAQGNPFGDPFGILPLMLVLFVGGFLGAFALFQVPVLQVPLAIPKADALSTALFTIFVVGFVEEFVFRFVVLQLLLPFGEVLAVVGSSATWAGFHFAAYGEQPLSILFIFAIGIALGFLFLITRRLGGIGLTWGVHAGWNLGVAGLLTVVH